MGKKDKEIKKLKKRIEELEQSEPKKRKRSSDGYCHCPEGPDASAGDYSQTCHRCGGNWY